MTLICRPSAGRPALRSSSKSFFSLPLISRAPLTFVLGLSVRDGLSKPKQVIQEIRRALLVRGVVRRSILFEAVANVRDGQVFGYWQGAHAQRNQSELREAIDPAETAGRDGHDSHGLPL